MQLPHIPLVVLDTETTGLLPRVNRVIEFASMRVRDGTIEDEYEQLISVPGEVPPPVRVLTRIKTEDLAGKPTMEDVRTDILSHIGEDTLIVGQNVGFDIKMLKGEGIDLSSRPWIDTSMLASLVYPELASYSLGYMSTVLDLNHEPVHRALGDVRATLELLEKCTERLMELPPDLLEIARSTLEKSSPGYKLFFGALAASKKKTRPTWLRMEDEATLDGIADPVLSADILMPPDAGAVRLVEEPLDPATLQSLIDAAAKDEGITHWIAVKNLQATVRRLRIPKGVRVLLPPFLLLDAPKADALLAQDSFTADEATLVTKLRWYEPKTEADLPLHGDEKSVWNGKIACTDTSDAYVAQFTKLPSVILLDHRQLLAFLADPEHAGHGVLTKNAHIIIDDASMMEDTATRAYGSVCMTDTLRAAAEGHAALTSFTDIVQIWVEQTRNSQDLRYLTVSDLGSMACTGMRDQLNTLQGDKSLPDTVQRQLAALKVILDPSLLASRIVWIESKPNGGHVLSSVPLRVDLELKRTLYEGRRVTLLIPPGTEHTHRAILPAETKRTVAQERGTPGVPMAFPEDATLQSILTTPPKGKTVMLVGSKRTIEEAFIKYTESLEAQDVTLICQGMGGGQGRMQAEFAAAEGTTVWLVTPWTFEGVELPPNTIDYLILQSFPFDHPSHAVIARRAELYDNAFAEYSMPRLLHRLFRLLRTYCKYRTNKGGAVVIDDRLRTKGYGKDVRGFLELFQA